MSYEDLQKIFLELCRLSGQGSVKNVSDATLTQYQFLYALATGVGFSIEEFPLNECTNV